MSVAQLAQPPLRSRGVYRAPFLGAAGEAVLIAVDSRSRLLQTRFVPPDEDLCAAFAALTDYLERVDPRPMLRAV